MGIVLIKIKIMPSSPDVDLENIKNSAKEIIASNNGMRSTFEEEPIAFGLKAIIASFDLKEESPLDPIEEKLRAIENVSSAEVIDMRRAFG